MPPALLSGEEILAILSASVPRIAALTAGIPVVQLNAPPQLGEWSANDILAHLRACQDVLGGNIRRIVAEERPAWKRKSPRDWQRRSGYHEWEFERAFRAFGSGRQELLAVLQPLRPDDWARVATVTVAPNRTAEQSARFFGDWLAAHERIHLDQLERTVRAVAVHRGTG